MSHCLRDITPPKPGDYIFGLGMDLQLVPPVMCHGCVYHPGDVRNISRDDSSLDPLSGVEKSRVRNMVAETRVESYVQFYSEL